MEQLVIRLIDTERAEWALYQGGRLIGNGGAVAVERLREAVPPSPEMRDIVLIVPGAEVLVTRVEVPVRQQRHLRTILPFLVEDQLAEDIAQVHVAAGARGADGKLSVAVIRASLLAQWMEQLRAGGFYPRVAVADTWLIPEVKDAWSLICDGQAVWVRAGEQVFAVERAQLADMLAVMGEPAAIACTLCDGDAEVVGVLQRVFSRCAISTAKAASAMEVFYGSYVQQQAGHGPVLNLLQGAFGAGQRGEGFGGVRKFARVAAYWAAAMVVVTGAQAAYFLYEAKDAQRQQVALYQQLFPADTKIVDPVRQMKAHLGAGQAQGSAGFLSLVGHLASYWTHDAGGLQMQGMRYEDDGAVLQVQVTAQSIEPVNGLMQQLNGAGLVAEVTSVMNDKNGVRGQLSIREAKP